VAHVTIAVVRGNAHAEHSSREHGYAAPCDHRCVSLLWINTPRRSFAAFFGPCAKS
jgi:hypothetical protein